MAGWDHWIDVDPRDVDLLRSCFKVWRRTCARHHVDFTYYRDRRSAESPRCRFWMAYEGRTPRIPLAVAEFAIEMRAVSTVQQGERRRRLPLRVLREVALVNVPDGVETEIDERLVPHERRGDVARLLDQYRSAHAAYRLGHLPAAELLEAQHSLFLNLALMLTQASTREKYPPLVDRLTSDPDLRADLKQLGEWRNRVKHRNERSLAGVVIGRANEITWDASYRLTGAYLDPVSEQLRVLVDDPTSVFRVASDVLPSWRAEAAAAVT